MEVSRENFINDQEYLKQDIELRQQRIKEVKNAKGEANSFEEEANIILNSFLYVDEGITTTYDFNKVNGFTRESLVNYLDNYYKTHDGCTLNDLIQECNKVIIPSLPKDIKSIRFRRCPLDVFNHNVVTVSDNLYEQDLTESKRKFNDLLVSQFAVCPFEVFFNNNIKPLESRQEPATIDIDLNESKLIRNLEGIVNCGKCYGWNRRDYVKLSGKKDSLASTLTDDITFITERVRSLRLASYYDFARRIFREGWYDEGIALCNWIEFSLNYIDGGNIKNDTMTKTQKNILWVLIGIALFLIIVCVVVAIVDNVKKPIDNHSAK